MECRICSSETKEILSLGDLYPAAFPHEYESWGEKFPLTLVKCTNCGLVQLSESPPLDTMYRQYWYKSGINNSMVKDLADITRDIETRIDLSEDDLVIDIGVNDGTLFKTYTCKDLITVGFDPALNLKPECTFFFNDYFPNGVELPKKAKVITSIAVFYDIPDPNEFIEGIKSYLDKDGIWVIQLTDLASMLRLTAFDNICHEHLEYYSLEVLVNLMRWHGLEVFSVSHNKVNGGSLRIFVAYPEAFHKSTLVSYYIDRDREILKDGWAKQFQERIKDTKERVCKCINNLVNNNKTISLLGASTKGCTLLQCFGLNDELIPLAAEVNEDKFGRQIIGTSIEILPEKEILEMHPDALLVLPWHFLSMLVQKKGISRYLRAGGKLIVPLPEPKVIYEKDGVLCTTYL